MAVERLDHCSIRTTKLPETQRFYEAVMGFTPGPRPPFPFPGAWMYIGDTAMVHLVGYDPNDPRGLRSYLGDKPLGDGTGTIDHVAFVADDLAGLKQRLDSAGCKYRERTVPSLALHQLFVEDPNGVTLELNFPGAEAS